MVVLELLVRVPRTQAARINQSETHSSFSQAARAEQPLAGDARVILVETVEPPDVVGFRRETHRLGDRCLHLEGEFVGLDAGPEAFVFGVLDGGKAVELVNEVEFVRLLLGSHAFWAQTVGKRIL